ncbi:MAG: protoporphyrinogen oxidase HemJ [Alphaproteobacteria bacterium]|nr:protoporphyrinogen oxidase HemJ [Alphaproteobacteria bacterium]
MEQYLVDYYNIIKIIHIIAVISWMAGLFYLPRLLVYHAENKNVQQALPIFKTMQRKLYFIIMQPAQIVTYLTGFYLALAGAFMTDGWMHVKLLMVFFMSIYHFYLNYIRKCFKNNNMAYTGRFLRILNEVPTVLLIVIITMVVLKPF